MFRLLRAFSEICEENGLRYFVVGGTLIGAVRHRGSFPGTTILMFPCRWTISGNSRSLHGSFPGASHSSRRRPTRAIRLCSRSSAIRGTPTTRATITTPWGLYRHLPAYPRKGAESAYKADLRHDKRFGLCLQVKLGWTEFVPYKKPLARAGFRMMNCLSATRLRRLRRRLIAGIYDEKSRSTLCSPGGAYSAEKEFFPAEWFAGAAKVGFEGVQFDARRLGRVSQKKLR